MGPITREFTVEMNRLADAFGDSVIRKERFERYWAMVHDLPLEAIRGLVDRVLDEARAPPLPKDFREFASLWRARNKSENVIEAPTPISCTGCFDTGISWVRVDGEAVWIFCDCAEGDQGEQKYRVTLPRLSFDEIESIETLEFPVQYFKPQEPVKGEKGILDNAFEKWRSWKRDLIGSERFWNSKRKETE